MLPQGREWFREVADGNVGSEQTLALMREMILAPDPIVDAAVTDILSQPATESLTPRQLAAAVFEWGRSHMLYTPDVNTALIIEEIRTPGYLLYEIATLGAAIGDCDDYVMLYGGLLTRLGYRCQMVAIARMPDGLYDHVYLQAMIDGAWVTLDGIVDFPFGWEVPSEEVTNRLEYPI